MEKRTKVLIVLLVVLGITSAGFYFYRSYQARTAPKPKMTITMGPPRKKGKAKSRMAGGAGPNGASANAPEQQKVNEQAAIKTVEAGKEVQYGTPDDFWSTRSLPSPRRNHIYS